MDLGSLDSFLSTHLAITVGAAVLITVLGALVTLIVVLLEHRKKCPRNAENLPENKELMMRQIDDIKDDLKQLRQEYDARFAELVERTKSLRCDFRDMRNELSNVQHELGLYEMNSSREHRPSDSDNGEAGCQESAKEPHHESTEKGSASSNDKDEQKDGGQQPANDRWETAKDWLKVAIPVYGQWHLAKKILKRYQKPEGQ